MPDDTPQPERALSESSALSTHDRSDEQGRAEPDLDQPAAIDSRESRVGRLWIEVGVVLSLMWLPAMFSSVASLIWFNDGSMPTPPFVYDMLVQIVDAVRVAAPVLFIMWLSRDGWARFGIRRVRPLLDVSMAAGLYASMWVAAFGYSIVLQSISPAILDDIALWGTLEFFPRPTAPIEWGLLIVGCLAIGVHEEIAVRGFLLPRFEEHLESKPKAVVLSALVFASYHSYQHPMEMVNIFIFGLLFGAAFVVWRRIWPLIIAHAIADVFSIAWA